MRGPAANDRAFAIWAAATSLAASALALLALSRDVGAPSYLVGGGLLLTLQFSLLRRATGTALPLAGLMASLLGAVGLAGYLFYPRIAAQALVSAQLTNAPVAGVAVRSYAAAVVALTAGALAVARPGSSIRNLTKTSLDLTPSRAFAVGLASSTVAMAATVAGYGWDALCLRHSYLDFTGPTVLVKFAGPANAAAFALLGLAISQSRGGGRRTLLTAAAAAEISLVFATGSRLLGLVPAALLLGAVAGRDQYEVRSLRPLLLITVLATVPAGFLPLALRSHDVGGAGYVPYGQFLISHPRSLLAPGLVTGIIGNILFAFPLTGYTAQLALPKTFLWVSLDPLPSPFTGWAWVQPQLRLNDVTPTNGLGELRAYGTPTLVLFFLVLGGVLTRLQARNRLLPDTRRRLMQLLEPTVVGYSALLLLQYNLRSAMRPLWYLLAVTILLHIIPRGTSQRGWRDCPDC